jgi:hypothetical protein
MLKRTWSLLLVVTLFAAPGAALAAAPDRDAADRQPTLLERAWDGLLWLLDLDGDGARERTREADGPRSISAGDDGSGHIDPNG